MSLHSLSCEVQLTHPTVSLGTHDLECDPLPGMEIMVDGQSYLVMERRNRYQLSGNHYKLHQVVLRVKVIHPIAEKSWHNGQWVIGNVSCQFNARSPVIRCAVNPTGPCKNCLNFLAITAPHPNEGSKKP